MIDQLRSIGIEKGKPFAPDEATRQILHSCGRRGQACLRRYNRGLPPLPEQPLDASDAAGGDQAGQARPTQDPDHYAIDARALAYTYAYISIKRPGTAQFYLIFTRDKDGRGFDGGQTYRLRVPANAPVEQYWSVTAYDRQTHALDQKQARASRAANAAEVKKNADGSTDVYFGPKAPAGQESNWVPTDPQRGFELMFRVYGPTKEFFEKAWVLPDVEKIAAQ